MKKYDFKITGIIEAQNKRLATRTLRKLFPKAKIIVSEVVKKK